MTDETVKALHGLKLPGMAGCWTSLEETHRLDKLSLRDGMQLMLQHECDTRQANRIARLIRNAGFRLNATMEELETDTTRGIPAAEAADLVTGGYKVSYASGTGGVCQTGYAAPYTISDPQLEIVNYYDNYVFIGHHLTSAMPTVSINTNLEQYATGSLTGQVVYATGGEALGTVSVYDQKGQLVRSVRKGLGGHVEDVRTAYSFTGAVDTRLIGCDCQILFGMGLLSK